MPYATVVRKLEDAEIADMERQVEDRLTAIALEVENPTRSSARVGDL